MAGVGAIGRGDRLTEPFKLGADEIPHTGPFAGVAANSKRIVFDGTAIYRLENGLIAETWLNIDHLSLLSQAGALPAMAEAA